MPSAWGHTRLLETDWRLITQESHCFSCGSVNSYFLSFQEGARLEIMNKPQMEKTEEALVRAGFIHLAFSAGSKEKADLLTETLRKGGYEVLSGPRTTGDGYYESLILGPERIQIEITE